MMTRKHYQQAAEILRAERAHTDLLLNGRLIDSVENRSRRSAISRIEDALIEMFIDDNPRFDERLFREASCTR